MTELMTPNMMYDSGRHINSTGFEFWALRLNRIKSTHIDNFAFSFGVWLCSLSSGNTSSVILPISFKQVRQISFQEFSLPVGFLLVRISVREAWLQCALKASLSFLLHTWQYENKKNRSPRSGFLPRSIITPWSYWELPVIMQMIFLLLVYCNYINSPIDDLKCGVKLFQNPGQRDYWLDTCVASTLYQGVVGTSPQ